VRGDKLKTLKGKGELACLLDLFEEEFVIQ
jgi:hypothetical protein